jgi:hypothetical protein
MKTEQEIKNASDGDLIKWYANAKTTYNLAAGHTKAAKNHRAMNVYGMQLYMRKVVPVTVSGEFNGEGSC